MKEEAERAPLSFLVPLHLLFAGGLVGVRLSQHLLPLVSPDLLALLLSPPSVFPHKDSLCHLLTFSLSAGLRLPFFCASSNTMQISEGLCNPPVQQEALLSGGGGRVGLALHNSALHSLKEFPFRIVIYACKTGECGCQPGRRQSMFH